MTNKSIKSILIANRGEIAVRIASTCRRLGIRVVTIYTDSEVDLPHVAVGHTSVCLGSGNLSETYLNIERIVSIAKAAAVDAVHPGYGFLSENSNFRRACDEAGLVFIGPSYESIVAMGDKIAARAAAENAGVPVVPGYSGAIQDVDFLRSEASKIGFPVMIKASAGGGGKGMRIVYDANDFGSALVEAKSEALSAFGNDQVFLEKFIVSPRHIEVQVFSDTHGNHLHLFERECSIQRRHQKIVEESPSPAVTPEIRSKLTGAAVKLTSALNYVNAGTVEFIMSVDGDVYFLEMNTRLQVEHPVTEAITGLDLVQLQIEVAQGDALPFSQEAVSASGHSIEARIYAENPARGHLPSVGMLSVMGSTTLQHVRIDTGYRAGNEVTSEFDPMLAKVIVWAATRNDAIRLMAEALNDYVFIGLETNRRYIQKIVRHSSFVAGDTYTNFVNLHHKELLAEAEDESTLGSAIAAFLVAEGLGKGIPGSVQRDSDGPWEPGVLSGFRSA